MMYFRPLPLVLALALGGGVSIADANPAEDERPGPTDPPAEPAKIESLEKLSKQDPRNDGMMLFDDQFIPGSTFIGCVNADHWAVSVPIARTRPGFAKKFVNHNDYPREALLEAILRFIEEDLGASD